MKFKPAKSQSHVINNGKPKKMIFKIDGNPIPTVEEKPIKCLGKWFTIDGKDTPMVQNMTEQAETWLKEVDKSGLPGSYKAWCYQHGILPRLIWPISIYDVPLTTIEKLEGKVSTFLRKWLSLPKSLSSIALYNKGGVLQLPMTSIVEEYKVAKVRHTMILRDNKDDKVQGAQLDHRTRLKWKAQDALEEAESRLRHKDLVGTVTQGRLGLGCITRAQWRGASSRQRREMVQQEVRQHEEETRQTKAVSLKAQGKWMRWENIRSRKLTWNELWKTEANKLKFAIASVYDVLPSPSNLAIWKLIDDPACENCGRRATLEHILSSCPKSLSGGKYRWRHDQVLEAIADGLNTAVKNAKGKQRRPEFIKFVKAATTLASKTSVRGSAAGILAMANDWILLVDLKRQLRFPEYIAPTNLRPDIVISSKESKVCVIMELTVPWEERIEEAHERKMLKYAELVDKCKDNGWKTWCFPFEIGCRGFPGQSTWRSLKMLGVTGKERRTVIDKAGRTAESASMWIWNRKRHTNPDNDTIDPHTSASSATSLPSETSVRGSATKAGLSHSVPSLASKTSDRGDAAAESARRGKSQHHQCAVCGSDTHQTLKKPCPKRRHRPLRNVRAFQGKNDILSNFYPCSVKVFERCFRSTEHAYQFMKARYYGMEELAEEICKQPNACGAKKLAKQVLTEASWDEEKLEVMSAIIRAKAECVPEYRRELLKCDVIVEAVYGDNYWSCGLKTHDVPWANEKDWPGKNIMGQLHMKLREELQHQSVK